MDPNHVNCLSKAYVDVCIWQNPSFQKIRPFDYQISMYSPGHVALETHTGEDNDHVEYISFWPGGNACKCQLNTPHLHTLEQDKLAENNQEPKRYKLHLNVESINSVIKKFKGKIEEGFLDWGVFASGVFCQTYEQNCASLTLYLLEYGGIKELTEEQGSTKYSRMIAAACTCAIIFGTLSLPLLAKLYALLKLSIDYNIANWAYCQTAIAIAVNNVGSMGMIDKLMIKLVQEFGRCVVNCEVNLQMQSSTIQTTMSNSLTPDSSSLLQYLISKLPDVKSNFSLFNKALSILQTVLLDIPLQKDRLISIIKSEFYSSSKSKNTKLFFFGSGVSLLIPTALSILIIAWVKEFMLKTLTPRDVKDLVKKAKAKQDKGTSIEFNKKHTQEKSIPRRLTSIPLDNSQELDVPKSFVRVWIWKGKLTQHVSAPIYGHIALEIFSKNKNNDKYEYISFWKDHCCVKGPNISCSQQGKHWHENKNIDDLIEVGKKAKYYDLDLDVDKICHAYNAIKISEKNSYNSVCSSSANLIAHLLDLGGLSQYSNYRDNRFISTFSKVAALVGSVFSVTTFVSYRTLSQMELIHSYAYNDIQERVSAILNDTSTCINICRQTIFGARQTAEFSDLVHTLSSANESEFSPLHDTADVCEMILDGVIHPMTSSNLALENFANEHLSTNILQINGEFFRVSKLALIPVAICLIGYFLNKFLSSKEIRVSDIERAVKKTQKEKEKEMMRMSHADLPQPGLNGIWESWTWKKTAILAISLFGVSGIIGYYLFNEEDIDLESTLEDAGLRLDLMVAKSLAKNNLSEFASALK